MLLSWRGRFYSVVIMVASLYTILGVLLTGVKRGTMSSESDQPEGAGAHMHVDEPYNTPLPTVPAAPAPFRTQREANPTPPPPQDFNVDWQPVGSV